LPAPGSSGRLTRSRTLAIILIVALALAAYAFVNVGRFFTKEDPLQRADAIAVLAGTRTDRALEAADLYQRGLAPRIVLSKGLPERSAGALARRGIALRTEVDVTRAVLQKLGIPADAIIVPDRLHDNTAQEGQTLRRLAAANAWHRLIIVTSRYHLRRAGFALRRELAGTGTELIMHGTPYDDTNPDRWWTSRADWRWVLSEGPKLVMYELGLGA
jgi:uncharacterized SAM-binding protein YcdF (DUF218 family)